MSNDLETIFGGGFDPNSVEAAKNIQAIPPGDYTCLVEKAETKQTKARTGHILSIILKVVDGEYAGRKVFHNINVANPSAVCVKIGLGELASLSKAIGLQGLVQSSAQLTGAVVIAHVKVKDGQNDVRAYSPAGSGPAPVGPPTPVPGQGQHPTAYPPVQYQQPGHAVVSPPH